MITGMILASALAATGGNGVPKVTRQVQIDGARYRVTTKGDMVEVARKSLVVKYGLQERDRQRRAVKIATGCDVSDELFDDAARLHGRLECAPH